MATRSRIGLLEGDKVKSIYCHYDGYPAFVGKVLFEFYKSKERVEALLSLGNLSYIAPRIEPLGAHSFSKPEKETCVFYGRDRGETETEAVEHSYEDYIGFVDNDWTEYHYIYKDGEWYYLHHTDKKEYKLNRLENNLTVDA
jgi:hypothetical protein